MKDHRLDFHGTLRRLCAFRPSFASPSSPPSTSATTLEAFAESILALTPEPERLDVPNARSEWLAWLRAYAARIESERDLWNVGEGIDADVERERAMRAANPRFVLRQWVLEEVIRRVEADADSGKRILAKTLQVSTDSRSVLRVCAWR